VCDDRAYPPGYSLVVVAIALVFALLGAEARANRSKTRSEPCAWLAVDYMKGSAPQSDKIVTDISSR